MTNNVDIAGPQRAYWAERAANPNIAAPLPNRGSCGCAFSSRCSLHDGNLEATGPKRGPESWHETCPEHDDNFCGCLPYKEGVHRE